MSDYLDSLLNVQRERKTEERIRQLDTCEIVTEIHGLEDEIEQLESKLEELGEENAALREQLRWRDVGEELPDQIDEYLIASVYEDAGDYVTSGYFSGGGWVNDEGLTHYAVTHWMPLPIPPQDKDQGSR